MWHMNKNMPLNKKSWRGSSLSITAKYKFYFTNASINLSAVCWDVKCWVEVSSAAKLNLYSDTMLYYVTLTNIRQGVQRDKRVELHMMNNFIKSNFI